MKTLTTLANELLEEIHAINNTTNFNYSSSYGAYLALRMIKSSNVIQSRYSFEWDNINPDRLINLDINNKRRTSII